MKYSAQKWEDFARRGAIALQSNNTPNLWEYTIFVTSQLNRNTEQILMMNERIKTLELQIKNQTS